MSYNTTKKVRTKDLKSLATMVNSIIGTLSSLTTSTKTNLVAAVNAVKSLADTAQSTADTAKTNAATAQSTADTAKTNAATANTNIGTLSSLTTSTKTNLVAAVNAVKSLADTAQSTADTAYDSTKHIREALATPTSVHIRAGWRNLTPRLRSLGTSVTSAQWAQIAAGTFSDMCLGDYWEIGGHRHYIVDFDYVFNLNGWAGTATGITDNDPNGDPFVSYSVINGISRYPHHLVLMPGVGFGSGDVNDSDNAGKPYATSYYRTVKRKEIITQLEEWFGADHLMYWSEVLFTAYGPNNGNTSDYIPTAKAAFSCQAELPSVFQLTGIQPSMLNGRVFVGLGEAPVLGGQFALMRACPAFSRPIDLASGMGGYYSGVHPITRDPRNGNANNMSYYRIFGGHASGYGNPYYRPFYIIK